MPYPYTNFTPYQYPSPYQQNPQYQQNAQYQQMPQYQQTQQIQNGGFISVRNIEEARNWAIAPGNSITFKDESAPYIYTKTMGYNQLDTPRFERYRLVKEDEVQPVAEKTDAPVYAMKDDLEALKAQVEGLKKRVETFKAKRQEVVDDE